MKRTHVILLPSLRRAAFAALALTLAACSDDEASGAPGSGARMATVTLATTDVAVVKRTRVEAGLPITGDLRPIESFDVRAQIEGDIIDVNAREGQIVRRGEVLATFEAAEQTSNTRSAEADVAAARSEQSTAQWNLEQTRDLFREGAVPERDVRNAEQQLAAANARVAAAQARLQSSSVTLADTRVRAPMAGTVAMRQVSPGEHVARGATLFTLVRTDILELAAAVPARAANDIEPGQTVRFTAGGRTIDGRIARVSPTISPSSRSITVYVQVPNQNGTLKGGTFASGRVLTRTLESALVIPTTALRYGADGSTAFVYEIENGVIARTPVTLGMVDDALGSAEVLSGLQEGDQVVVGNVGLLGEGMRAQVVGAETGR